MSSVGRWSRRPRAEQLEIQPPVMDSHYLIGRPTFHAIRLVHDAIRIQQHWPGKLCLFQIGFSAPGLFEGDDQHRDLTISNPIFLLSQLRQMLSTRQSRQMTVEDQQQKLVSIVRQAMQLTGRVFKRERNCWRSHKVVHGSSATSRRRLFQGPRPVGLRSTAARKGRGLPS